MVESGRRGYLLSLAQIWMRGPGHSARKVGVSWCFSAVSVLFSTKIESFAFLTRGVPKSRVTVIDKFDA